MKDTIKRALVVNNDFFFVEFLSQLLENRGYLVAKAYDGKEGIAHLQTVQADIVFTDIILPKVDGRHLIQFARDCSPDNHCTIVVLSGVILEQLEGLGEMGADFYIAIGPSQKLADQIEEFMIQYEAGQFPSANGKRVLATGNLYPRREAMELMKLLEHQRAVIESLGVGVLTLDGDTRIIHANALALKILGKSVVDVLNRSIMDVFPAAGRSDLAAALKQVVNASRKPKKIFYLNFNLQLVRTIATPVCQGTHHCGWVIALEDPDLDAL
jgi:CheY-like chemotaxis protein